MRLPNDQKRLRHLECVGVRHLAMPDGRLFSGYFTLHDAIDGREFYRSEVLEGTCNPTWRNVDVNAYQNSPDLGSSAVVVRVWSSPAADAGEPGATQPLQVLAWDVDLYGLQFIRKKVSIGSGCDSRGLLAPRVVIVAGSLPPALPCVQATGRSGSAFLPASLSVSSLRPLCDLVPCSWRSGNR